MPTIRDVARTLNLSITTVSRALDGYGDVSKETRQRVIETAQAMGYVPNRAARQLRRQRTDTIGYIVPAEKPQFADPFFAEFVAGLGDEAASTNYDLLVSTAPPDSPEEQDLYRRWIQGGKVDGVIINRTRLSDWRVNFLRESKLPFTCLERSLDQGEEFLGVETDIKDGYQELLGHLTAQGHSRIAFIGADASLKVQYDRLRAFQQALTSLDIQPQANLIVEGDLTPEGGYQAMLRLLALDQPPTDRIAAAAALDEQRGRADEAGPDLVQTRDVRVRHGANAQVSGWHSESFPRQAIPHLRLPAPPLRPAVGVPSPRCGEGILTSAVFPLSTTWGGG